ncbi:hypothetical protein TPA0907_17020 [Micromonospora humidisoli]|nr:hypothetical protein TPA0907_17020 [Micromonospora sp. AKA109]
MSAATPDRPLITFDTVGTDTPADAAIAAIVTGLVGTASDARSPPGPPDST